MYEFTDIAAIYKEIKELLANDSYEPQQIAEVLNKLDIIIANISQDEKPSPKSAEKLRSINLFIIEVSQLISSDREALINNLKDINMGRKARHNYLSNK